MSSASQGYLNPDIFDLHTCKVALDLNREFERPCPLLLLCRTKTAISSGLNFKSSPTQYASVARVSSTSSMRRTFLPSNWIELHRSIGFCGVVLVLFIDTVVENAYCIDGRFDEGLHDSGKG